jgi:hypothetical protein
MLGLTASQLIGVWELGRTDVGTGRALTVLGAACPDRTRDELVHLPLGHRDALLLGVRAATIGPGLDSMADCPACGGQLEFSLDTAELQSRVGDTQPTPDPAASYTLATDGVELEYRLPDSADLLAVAVCPDVASGRVLLIRRCVLGARRNGEAVAVEDLPDGALDALATGMAAGDSGAEIELNLTCPVCGHGWRSGLDIAAFFWAEIDALARRLLLEVDALARTYGWREADILRMTAARRLRYLELAGNG